MWGGCRKLLEKLSDDHGFDPCFVGPLWYLLGMSEIEVVPTTALRPGVRLAGASSPIREIESAAGGVIIRFEHPWKTALIWTEENIGIQVR